MKGKLEIEKGDKFWKILLLGTQMPAKMIISWRQTGGKRGGDGTRKKRQEPTKRGEVGKSPTKLKISLLCLVHRVACSPGKKRRKKRGKKRYKKKTRPPPQKKQRKKRILESKTNCAKVRWHRGPAAERRTGGGGKVSPGEVFGPQRGQKKI